MRIPLSYRILKNTTLKKSYKLHVLKIKNKNIHHEIYVRTQQKKENICIRPFF